MGVKGVGVWVGGGINEMRGGMTTTCIYTFPRFSPHPMSMYVTAHLHMISFTRPSAALWVTRSGYEASFLNLLCGELSTSSIYGAYSSYMEGVDNCPGDM